VDPQVFEYHTLDRASLVCIVAVGGICFPPSLFVGELGIVEEEEELGCEKRQGGLV